MRGLSSSQVVSGGVVREGWWLVVPEDAGPDRIVAGPYRERGEAVWAAGAADPSAPERVRPVYGTRREDGSLGRRPSPQDWAWLAHLGEQLDRMPEDWDAELSDDDPITTLVVEIAAAVSEAGLPMHDSSGVDAAIGGACLTPEPVLGGVVVAWRQHDRMSVDRAHGVAVATAVQQVMNRALADVLVLRGFSVHAFGESGSHVVRAAE